MIAQLAFAMVCVLSPPDPSAGSDEITRIRTAHRSWREKIEANVQSIWLRGESLMDPNPHEWNDFGYEWGMFQREVEVIWTEGFERSTTTVHRNGLMESRNVDISNGNVDVKLRSYNRIPIDQVSMEVSPVNPFAPSPSALLTVNKLMAAVGVDVLAGHEILECEFRGYEYISGVTCPVLDVFRPSTNPSQKLMTTYILDPRFDYLAREWKSQSDNGYKVVHEFQRIKGELSFPKQVSVHNLNAEPKRHWVLHINFDVLSLNQPLDAALFEPEEVPDGTYIQDGVLGVNYRKGEEPRLPPTRGAGADSRSWTILWSILLAILIISSFLSYRRYGKENTESNRERADSPQS
jgi:hypothetical protein